jgi:hypothetical protein
MTQAVCAMPSSAPVNSAYPIALGPSHERVPCVARPFDFERERRIEPLCVERLDAHAVDVRSATGAKRRTRRSDGVTSDVRTPTTATASAPVADAFSNSDRLAS